jgi:hypothetical protein
VTLKGFKVGLPKEKKTMKKTLRGKPLCNNDIRLIQEKVVHKTWKEKNLYVCGHHPSSLQKLFW